MKNNNGTFSVALCCSVILHLLTIYFFVFGLPALFDKLPEEQVIVFEMLPINEKPNVPTKIKQLEKAIENEDAKKVEQSKPKTQEEAKPIEEEKPVEPPKPIDPPKPLEEKKAEPTQPKVAEPKEIIKEKPQAETQKKKKEDTLEKKKEAAPIKTPTEKKQEVDPNKKAAEKKKKAPNNKSDLDSLLKNLEQSSEGNNVKSNKQARSAESNELQESKGPYDDRLPLSISEAALIKQQIEKQWNIPIGAENIDQARVTFYIALNKDGSVKDVRVINTVCPNMSASICSALSDSALRAVWKASPIQGLDNNRYNTWKEFNFDFKPRY